MLLYTVQPFERDDSRETLADRIGLTERLGYDPIFCSLINPDSLADSWFRIWSASPGFCETIRVYDVRDADAVPMDVVDWGNLCLSTEGCADADCLEKVLQVNHMESTDYLLRANGLPEPKLEFPILPFINGTISPYMAGVSDDWKSPMGQALLIASHNLVRLPFESHLAFGGEDYGEDPSRIPMELWYRLATTSGFIPFIWSQATGHNVPLTLISYQPRQLVDCKTYDSAQRALISWDDAISSGKSFNHGSFDTMRRSFISSLNRLSRQIAHYCATELGIDRNDPCFCGSGKKFKSCCAQKTLDQFVARAAVV